MSNNEETMLDIFVSFIEKYDLEIGGTFIIDGQLLTGRIISTKKYFNLLSSKFKSGNKPAHMVGEKMQEALDNIINEEDKYIESNQYISMNNVKIIYNGENNIKVDNVFRIKKSSISAFTFGEMDI
jgi:hypothetical protein